MAATETADHIVALPLSPSPGGGSRNRRREGFRERECVCGWEPTLNSKQKTKKRNPKYQNMSEWIITIPRHRGMEWEEGRSRRKDGGQECWNELKRRVRADVPLSYLSIVWKKCLHMGTESTQTYTDKDSNYSFCLSHTHKTHTPAQSSNIYLPPLEISYCFSTPPPSLSHRMAPIKNLILQRVPSKPSNLSGEAAMNDWGKFCSGLDPLYFSPPKWEPLFISSLCGSSDPDIYPMWCDSFCSEPPIPSESN